MKCAVCFIKYRITVRDNWAATQYGKEIQMAIEKTKVAEQSEAPADAQVLSSEAAARRHLLLKGLGRGSAVLAASIPLKALATLSPTSVFTNPKAGPQIRCGISGMTSGIRSQDTITKVCSGYSPVSYQNSQIWPSNVNQSALITSVFPTCALRINGVAPTLLYVMQNLPLTPEFHWLGAWLNAKNSAQNGFNFPYTAAQVKASYKGHVPGGYTKAQALAFLTKYMETQ